MIIYSFKNEVDLDDWLLKYAEHNTTYNADQYENYLYMKKDFEQYQLHNKED